MRYHLLNVFIGALFLIFGGCSGSSPGDENTSADTTQTERYSPWGETYTNSRYDISLRIPENWILLEESNLKPAMGKFAINIFKRGTGAEKKTPLQVHAEAQHSYVAIWPHGYGTELPASQYTTFDKAENPPELKFSVNQQSSKLLQLKDGTTWAYFIIPKNPPAGWEEHGFIFAQISTTNNRSTCYDEQKGNEIPMDECDFLGGDRYVREGELNRQDQTNIRRILKNISLNSVKKEPKASDLIKIEKPLPNTDITSPLTIKGKARGQWFFEGSFRVELQDAGGNTLAETHANAQGDWMTKNFVPFTATLTFDAPDDERGQLIFHRANPSDLPENANSYSLPVIFPPE